MRRGVNSSGTETFSIRAFNSVINSSQTGGTSTEVRLNFVGDDLTPYARNTMYLIGGNWVASDNGSGGGQCPSNGVNISLFTLNPRGGTFCGYSTDTATSFDVDLTGKGITTTLAEMRLYGSFDFGRDYSSYGPLPATSDPEYPAFAAAFFPAGSKLRFQVSQTTSSAPQLFTSNGSRVISNTTTYANLAAMRAGFSGGYNSVAITDTTTLAIYSWQSNSTPAIGATGQKRLRAAFDPAIGNGVTWYICDTNSIGQSINCVNQGTTTWSETMQGGKAVLRFASTPTGVDAQRNSRTLLIEHNGLVYYGSEDVLNNKTYSQRLNRDATNAIFKILSGSQNFDIARQSTCTTGPCSLVLTPAP
jgi:hypothetical protein